MEVDLPADRIEDPKASSPSPLGLRSGIKHHNQEQGPHLAPSTADVATLRHTLANGDA